MNTKLLEIGQNKGSKPKMDEFSANSKLLNYVKFSNITYSKSPKSQFETTFSMNLVFVSIGSGSQSVSGQYGILGSAAFKPAI